MKPILNGLAAIVTVLAGLKALGISGLIDFLLTPIVVPIVAVVAAIAALIATALFAGLKTLRPDPSRATVPRPLSDAEMISDVREHAFASFLGVSHGNLSTYLAKALTARARQLEGVAVYFANDNDGFLWQGEAFRGNLRRARLSIATMLTEPNLRGTSNNFCVSFWQTSLHSTFGGCTLGQSSDAIDIQYVTLYSPYESSTEHSMTLRLGNEDTLTPLEKNFKIAYADAFRAATTRDPKRVGSYHQTLWDRSAIQWDNFTRSCRAYHDSMGALAEIGQLQHAKRILELGAGTGWPTKVLRDAAPQCRLTLADKSPQVLAQAQRTFGDEVTYALLEVPTAPGERLIDLEGQGPFDAIVMHLVLPEMASSTVALEHLAHWCNSQLAGGGRTILAVHNTAVVHPTAQYDVNQDPLRAAFKRAIPSNHLRRMERWRPFTLTEIERAFETARLSVGKVEDRSFAMTIDDRLRMWAAPVVMADLVEPDKVSQDLIANTIEAGRRAVGIDGIQTPPLMVRYWVFQKN